MRHMETYEGPHELAFNSAPNQLTAVTLLPKLASPMPRTVLQDLPRDGQASV